MNCSNPKQICLTDSLVIATTLFFGQRPRKTQLPDERSGKLAATTPPGRPSPENPIVPPATYSATPASPPDNLGITPNAKSCSGMQVRHEKCQDSPPEGPRGRWPDNRPVETTAGDPSPEGIVDPNRVGHTEPRRDARTHVDVVFPAAPFQQLHPPLATQFPQDPTNLTPELPIQHYLALLWLNHHVILTLPPNAGQACPFMHGSGSPSCPTGPSQRENLSPSTTLYAGSLRSSSGHTARGRGFKRD